MPFTNLDNRHFTAAEKTTINNTLTALEAAFANKQANLDEKERKRNGSVNEENKLIVNKVKDYRDNQPALSSPDVDWAEFMQDYDTRSFIQASILRFESLIKGLGAAKILHDWDNYQASLTDYRFSKYKQDSGAIGFDTKVEELSQFFTGGNTGKESDASKEEETDETNV